MERGTKYYCSLFLLLSSRSSKNSILYTFKVRLSTFVFFEISTFEALKNHLCHERFSVL